MENIENFLAKLNHQKQSRHDIADAILGHQKGRYTWYRLRYFSIKSLLMILVHCLEFYLLFQVFNTSLALSILTFRIIGFISSSFWWGALESFREQLRSLNHNQHPERSSLYQSWSRYANYFSCVVSLVILGLFIHHLLLTPLSNYGLFCCYVFIILVEINARIRVLTKHACCFATHRVYRPFFSVIAPPLIGLFILGVFWYPLEGYSLILAGIGQVGSTLYWTWKYTHQMLKHRRIDIQPRRIKALQKIHHRFRNLQQALTSVLIDGSGLIILIVFHDFTAVYLLTPLIATCFNWAKLFYFDNIKYQSYWYRLLIKPFNDYTYVITIIIAFALTLISYGLLSILSIEHSIGLLIALWLFFTTRALLSIRSIIIFTRCQYSLLLYCHGVLIALLLYCSTLSWSLTQLLITIALAQGVLYLCLMLIKVKQQQNPYQPRLQPLYPWLESQTPTHMISKISLTKEANSSQITSIIQALNRYYKNDSLTLTIYNKQIFLSTPHHHEALNLKWLACETSGLITQYNHDVGLNEFIHKNDCVSKAYLKEKFHEHFPTAYFIDLHFWKRAQLPFDNSELLSTIKQHIEHPDIISTRTPYYCNVLYRAHQLDTIFIIPKQTTDYSTICQWHEYILDQNLGSIFSKK